MLFSIPFAYKQIRIIMSKKEKQIYSKKKIEYEFSEDPLDCSNQEDKYVEHVYKF